MGILIMLAVTGGVFSILYWLWGGWVAALGSIAFLAGWFLFNIHAGTKGLVKSNLKAYFTLLRMNHSHQDALVGMVSSRFSDRSTQLLVMSIFETALAREGDLFSTYSAQLQFLVYLVYIHEHHPGTTPPEGVTASLRETIENEFFRQLFRNKHALSEDMVRALRE